MPDQPAVVQNRRKMDGSLDLLCLNCLGTIVTAKDHAESVEHESHHICIPWLFSKRGILHSVGTSE